MVNDIKELEHRGRDKFVPTDVTISDLQTARFIKLSHELVQ